MAVRRWQSSQRREKPAATWLGLVVASKARAWQLPHSVEVVAYSKGRWPRWQAWQSTLACTAKSGKRVLLCTWNISRWLDQVRGE